MSSEGPSFSKKHTHSDIHTHTHTDTHTHTKYIKGIHNGHNFSVVKEHIDFNITMVRHGTFFKLVKKRAEGLSIDDGNLSV